jgi:hypothetical protein
LGSVLAGSVVELSKAMPVMTCPLSMPVRMWRRRVAARPATLDVVLLVHQLLGRVWMGGRPPSKAEKRASWMCEKMTATLEAKTRT